MVRHFFPVVDGAALPGRGGGDGEPDARKSGSWWTRHGLDLEQIGFRRQVRANFRGLARQEYAEDEESCFRASGDSVFELAAIEARLNGDACGGDGSGGTGNWRSGCRRWPGKKYLVAVDPAGGGSEGDYSAAQVLEMETGLQCAEFAGHVGGLELARLVTELAAEYNQAWLVVERNNHGSGVLALAETVCRYGRILQAGGTAGVADDFGEPAGDDRAAGCGAGGEAGVFHEPQAAGRVPGLCAACRMGGPARGRGCTTTG